MERQLVLIFLSCALLVGATFNPRFVEPINNVTVDVGKDATFTCVVSQIQGYRVGWVKANTKVIQAIGTHVITHNPRVSVSHDESRRRWMLHITRAELEDTGPYMCQLNTDPMKSQMGFLEVVIPPDIDDMESTVDGTLGDGRLFNDNTAVDMVGLVQGVEDKNRCCQECKTSYPDTHMILYSGFSGKHRVTYNPLEEKGNKECTCLKMMETADERLPTSKTRLFSGIIGNNSTDEELDIGEGFIFDQLSVTLVTVTKKMYDVYNQAGCHDECKYTNFFEIFVYNNRSWCSCYRAIPGVLPKTYAETYFSAICGNN